MNIRYQQQLHDGARTLEQQLYLITKEAKQLSEAASDLLKHIGSNHGLHHTNLGTKLQAVNRRIVETDIFMAGVHNKGD